MLHYQIIFIVFSLFIYVVHLHPHSLPLNCSLRGLERWRVPVWLASLSVPSWNSLTTSPATVHTQIQIYFILCLFFYFVDDKLQQPVKLNEIIQDSTQEQ